MTLVVAPPASASSTGHESRGMVVRDPRHALHDVMRGVAELPARLVFAALGVDADVVAETERAVREQAGVASSAADESGAAAASSDLLRPWYELQSDVCEPTPAAGGQCTVVERQRYVWRPLALCFVGGDAAPASTELVEVVEATSASPHQLSSVPASESDAPAAAGASARAAVSSSTRVVPLQLLLDTDRGFAALLVDDTFLFSAAGAMGDYRLLYRGEWLRCAP